MKYYMVQPSSALATYVRFFWVLEGDSKEIIPYIYRSMADGCSELIFHYKGKFEEITSETNIKQSFSLVHAQSAHFRRFVTNENFGIVGVYLYPFAIPQLFALSATELSNQMPDLVTLLGNTGKELEEKVMLAANNQIRIEIISAFLKKRFSKNEQTPTPIHASIKHVIHSKGIDNVGQLAQTFCLSTRQFERKFKELSGFSPKKYLRIIRFQTALTAYGHKNKSLTQLAYDCGYYDQSHFIHDFKSFSGFHPKQYFSGNAEGSEFRENVD